MRRTSVLFGADSACPGLLLLLTCALLTGLPSPAAAIDITKTVLRAAEESLAKGGAPINTFVGAAVDLAGEGMVFFTQKNPSVASDNGGYDFVFDISNLDTLASKGWPVTTSVRFEKYLASVPSTERAIPIAAVLGYYSKGKSFIVQEIFNAAHGEKGWLGNKNVLALTSGPGVTTKGVSGLFAAPDPRFGEATLLILDMAGRNAPATRPREAPGEVLSTRVKEMRLKERIVDDISLEIADSIVYVVDELLNEDQRILLHILQKATEKHVVLVHNFKRLPSDGEHTKNHIQEQIINAFGAKESFFASSDAKDYLGVRTFRSDWEQQDGKVRTMEHVVIFDNVRSADCNKRTFLYLARMLMDRKPTASRHLSTTVQHVFNVTKRVLSRLVRAERVPAETLISQTVDSEDRAASFVFRPSGVTKFIPASIFDDLVPVPTIISHGDYRPPAEVYTNATHFIIAVDTPEFSSADFGSVAQEMQQKRNWFTVSFNEENVDFARVQIEGFHARRLNPPSSKETRHFGRFHLSFDVPFYYGRYDPRVTIADGLLQITYSKIKSGSTVDEL